MTSTLSPVIVKSIERFRSKQLHNQRGLTIFLPPDYDRHATADCHYKVLYVNDGQDMAAVKLAETLTTLIAHHEIEPIIVVAIHATRDRVQEYGTAGIANARGLGKKARKYSFFILDEVLPYINRRYRTLTGAVNTAIMGFSLGGLMAFDLAWNHPDVFGAVGVFSGSFWWRTLEADIHARQESRIMHRRVRDTETPGQLRLWFEAGTLDEKEDRDNNGVIDAIQDTTELMDELERKGFRRGLDMIYVQVEGGEHHQRTWGFALPYFLRWTFPTATYAQQQPRDGLGFLSVSMQGRAGVQRDVNRRRNTVQAKRVLRVAGVRSKIIRRNQGR
ncbi:MAG TPA: alpha/beta hydrolase-fold protein [Anaerolineae bacterium]|nr:alpha/beta hydrolase-fold protein [Anaerolineae bacterium]